MKKTESVNKESYKTIDFMDRFVIARNIGQISCSGDDFTDTVKNMLKLIILS